MRATRLTIGFTVASRKRAPAPRCADPCFALRRAVDSGRAPCGWRDFGPAIPHKWPSHMPYACRRQLAKIVTAQRVIHFVTDS